MDTFIEQHILSIPFQANFPTPPSPQFRHLRRYHTYVSLYFLFDANLLPNRGIFRIEIDFCIRLSTECTQHRLESMAGHFDSNRKQLFCI